MIFVFVLFVLIVYAKQQHTRQQQQLLQQKISAVGDDSGGGGFQELFPAANSSMIAQFDRMISFTISHSHSLSHSNAKPMTSAIQKQLLLDAWQHATSNIDNNSDGGGSSLKSIADVVKVAESATVSSSSMTAMKNFPRNISDFLSLRWYNGAADDSSSEFVAVDDDDQFGTLSLTLFNNASDDERIDLVSGRAYWSNRSSSSSSSSEHQQQPAVYHYILQGIYLWQTGSLFLVASATLANQTIERSYLSALTNVELDDIYAQDDVAFALRANDAPIDMLRSAARFDALDSLLFRQRRNLSAVSSDDCYLKIVLQFAELPAGQRTSKWARRRRRGSILATALGEFDIEHNNDEDNNIDDDDDDDDDDEISLNVIGFMQSPNCASSSFGAASLAGASESIAQLRYKVRLFGVVALGVALLLLLAMAKLFATMYESNVTASRVSLLTIASHALLDWHLCTIYLMLNASFDGLTNPFALLAFIKFLTFAFFQMSSIFVIVRARRRGALGNSRRDFCYIYGGFYCVAMLALMLCWSFGFVPPLLMFLLYSFWVPQIAQNLISGSNVSSPLSIRFLLTASACRLFEPMYMLMCPHNFLHYRTHRWSLLLLAYVIVQAFILIWQRKYGARSLIPKQWRPAQYDYARPRRQHDSSSTSSDNNASPSSTSTTTMNNNANANVNANNIDQSSQQCSICLSDVGDSDQYMLTPCNHIFHQPCLLEWMKTRMACPVCRADLPDL